MAKEKVYCLKRLDYSDEGVVETPELEGTREALMNYVGSYAGENNYGVYRVWTENGRYYYDCGPTTFISPIRLEPLA